MKVNSQIRRESWKRLFSVWFWRLVLGSAVIGLATNLPVYFLREYHESREIVSVTDFLRQRLEALSQGMDWSLPTPEAVRQMYLAGSLEVLAMIVFGAIAALGMVSLSLSACRNRPSGWFQSGFKGFLRPLSVAWLLLVQNVLISLGFCLFIIPGVILLYRYRQAWYVKSENPDWGAFRCLRASARMMKGRKAQAFFLDVSCLCWLVLPCALMVAGVVLLVHGDYAHDALKGLIGSLILLFAYAVAFLVGLWMLICRGTFYLAVKAEQPAEEGDDFPRDDLENPSADA